MGQNIPFSDIWALKHEFFLNESVRFLGKFGIKLKAQASKIGTYRKPNQQKFQFRSFPEFGRSVFRYSLYNNNNNKSVENFKRIFNNLILSSLNCKL